MKIYTRAGDDGSTGLLGAGRFSKGVGRIEAYGSVDELNATMGLALASGLGPEVDPVLREVQDDLFAIGSALADPEPDGRFARALKPARVSALEEAIDRAEATLPPLTQFLLPGGSEAAARLHLARTVCRRAERAVVRLSESPGEFVASELIAYLNRLSDLLFVLGRVENHRAGVGDIPWKGLE